MKNIFGEEMQSITKCRHCGKPRMEHKAVTRECPKGMKHRTVGYTYFGPEKFEAKPTKEK